MLLTSVLYLDTPLYRTLSSPFLHLYYHRHDSELLTHVNKGPSLPILFPQGLSSFLFIFPLPVLTRVTQISLNSSRLDVHPLDTSPKTDLYCGFSFPGLHVPEHIVQLLKHENRIFGHYFVGVWYPGYTGRGSGVRTKCTFLIFQWKNNDENFLQIHNYKIQI